jgi:Icc-related predicted phosphoesterase
MKIIALPDIHEGGVRFLSEFADALASVDLVLLVGDMTNNSNNIAHIVNAVQKHNPNIRAVTGNWDNDDTDTYLSLQHMNLHGQHEIIDGMAFLGAGGASAPTAGPRAYGERQFTMILEQTLDGLDAEVPKILVCHQPPTGFLGIRSLGSPAIRTFIEQTQPILCFVGHIHAAKGIDTIGTTQIINPGPLYKGAYAYAEVVDGQVKGLEIRDFEIPPADES